MDNGDTVQGVSQETIGILGAGRVGTAIARLAVAAGYRVKVATSKPAAENELIIEIVTPGAIAVEALEAASADLVVVAIPLHKYKSLSAEALSGRTVIDAMNYWAATDGDIADFENTELSSSEVVAAYLSGSHVVKSFNHIGYHEMEPDAAVSGSPSRRALGVAGDDVGAKERVARFLDAVGFDAIDTGDLASGKFFEPGTRIFNGSFTGAEFSRALKTGLVAV